MLDVRRLKVLKEVAEQGSFSAAAESLAYTQSAVSQQIAALEREAGTTLVEREPEEGVAMLKAGDLDIALSIGYEGAGTVHNRTDGIEEVDLFDDPTFIAMAVDHRLAHKSGAKLADFAEDQWIHSACKGTCG